MNFSFYRNAKVELLHLLVSYLLRDYNPLTSRRPQTYLDFGAVTKSLVPLGTVLIGGSGAAETSEVKIINRRKVENCIRGVFKLLEGKDGSIYI